MTNASVFTHDLPTHSTQPWGEVKRWFAQQGDGIQGFLERRRKGPPSPRAWAEMLDYYAGLYQERGPDPKQFRRVLRRCGIPQCSNPFPEGEAQHFLYHPDLLIMADLEALLSDMMDHWAEQEKAPGSAPQEVGVEPLSPDEWPDVGQSMRLRDLELARQAREWSRLAGVCWALVLLDGQSLVPLLSQVHAANLGWATIHAWKTAPLTEWGIESAAVLNAAQEHGILPAEVVQRLLTDAHAEIQLT